MAYARRKSGSYRARKPTKRSARRSRYTVKTRPYTKRRTSRKPMTKKRILNVTSRKKRDTLLSYSNTTSTGASQTTNIGSAYVAGNGQGIFLWCATARDLTRFDGGAGAIGQEATRTSTTCYMRGLAENIRVQTSSGAPWLWRRICFKVRGNNFFTGLAASDTPVQPFNPFVETSNGMGRLWFNEQINAQGNTISGQLGALFRGQAGFDWNDVMTAPVDNRRVDVCYDRYRIVRSGNANGTIKDYKVWHPMNKNLVYGDDESGDVEITSNYSVYDKRGMGDYFIIDFVQPGTGGTSSDIIQLSSTATLYWHEK